MISKKEFREIEREYDIWWYKHEKFGYSYKAYSHMKRTTEFAKYYSSMQIKNLNGATVKPVKVCHICGGEGDHTVECGSRIFVDLG